MQDTITLTVTFTKLNMNTNTKTNTNMTTTTANSNARVLAFDLKLMLLRTTSSLAACVRALVAHLQSLAVTPLLGWARDWRASMGGSSIGTVNVVVTASSEPTGHGSLTEPLT